ncbi:GNAT family N-acetyltransferase [Candidatus Parcubacteria bacterium]|nr:GNAT family N-acetyltransferase [Candidatus Parcubacteria bacterium]
MFRGTIRSLELKDVESVGEIFDLYWHDNFRQNLEDKLQKYTSNDSDLAVQNFKFFVAEENGEVVGVAAIRRAPQHMKGYTTTSNPGEFYVAAAKERGRGIGKALIMRRFDEAKKDGYTEIVLFGGETHQDSWGIYDKNFERAGAATAPNGEKGFVWRKLLN